MSLYANTRFGGQKMKGVNGVPRGVDSFIPGGVTDPGAEAYYIWYNCNYAWGTGDAAAWAWIQAQIDIAHTNGFNGFRWFFDPNLRIGTLTTLTAPQFAVIIAQIAAYCGSLGMVFYPCLSDSRTIAHFSLTATPHNAYITEATAVLATYANIYAIDVVQEIDSLGTGSVGYTNFASWIATAKAARGSADIPVTCSFNGASSSADLVWASRFKAASDAGADFADGHVYYDAATSDLDPLLFNAGSGASGTTDFPIIIGEMGSPSTDSGASITNRYTTLAAWANRARVQAMFVWAMVDITGVQTYGVYTDHQAAGVFDTPRTTQLTKTALMPVVPGPYDAAEDVGALVEAAPTVTISGTRADLSWTAAAGSGTKTYTPQYVPLDANGFPSTTWQSGSATTSTSAHLVGLTANTSYAFRIQTVN